MHVICVCGRERERERICCKVALFRLSPHDNSITGTLGPAHRSIIIIMILNLYCCYHNTQQCLAFVQHLIQGWLVYMFEQVGKGRR